MYCHMKVKHTHLASFYFMNHEKLLLINFPTTPTTVIKSNFLAFSEDILKSDNAIWISPDGQKIVYATFNDSQVQSVQWKIYGDGRDASVNPYPTEAFMRYPKVCNKAP